jgi:hypothetical protein
MSSQTNIRTYEADLRHFKDTHVRSIDRRRYTHVSDKGHSSLDTMKHNFENNIHKIQGRMDMKKDHDSYSRNRNTQRLNKNA